MGLFAQNSKMKSSSKDKPYRIVNFGTPAIVTCPNAGECASYCYARWGTFRFKGARAKYWWRLRELVSPGFVAKADEELNTLCHGKRDLVVRINDSGDIYSSDVLDKWIEIMTHHPSVMFYAYTKMVSMIKSYGGAGKLPANFITIYSLGGKEDNLVDLNKDRHAKIFRTAEDAAASGYEPMYHDDSVAWGPNPKIGLVAHGCKKNIIGR